MKTQWFTNHTPITKFPVWVMHHTFKKPAIFYGPTRLARFSFYTWHPAIVPEMPKHTYVIERSWTVRDQVTVEANTQEEAYILANRIPLTEPHADRDQTADSADIVSVDGARYL